jgi:hypothetical protein
MGSMVFIQCLMHCAICFLGLLFACTCRAYDVDGLREASRSASGVYRPGGKESIPNTVILAMGNFAYMNHIHNYKCWLDRLHMKALVFSLDEKGYQAIKSIDGEGNKTDRAVYTYLWKAGEGEVNAGNADFGTKQFHVVTMSKIEATLAVMKLGYDVFVMDTDVALIRDPFPFLIWNNVDYVHTMNLICPQGQNWDFWKSKDEGNTGVYWVRSTKNTMALFEAVIEAAPSKPMLDDQNLFWIVIRSKEFADQSGIDMVALPSCRDFDYSGMVRTTAEVAGKAPPPNPKKDTPANASLYRGPFGQMVSYAARRGISTVPLPKRADHANELVSCPLDPCTFSAGGLRGVAYLMLENGLRAREANLVAAHANYLNGNERKMDALKSHGLWLPQEDGSCATFNGPKTCEQYPDMCKPHDYQPVHRRPWKRESRGAPAL